MARLTSPLTFTGSLGNLSAYRVKGSDEIHLRRKGGASAKQIREAPQFESTRRLNAEFGARASMSKRITQALFQLKQLADYNLGGRLNALLKPVQELDTTSEFGRRNICLSRNPKLLQGFSFNKITSMDSLLFAPVTCSIEKASGVAMVRLPQVLPGVNFRRFDQYPVYSFISVLAVVPDLFWSGAGYVQSQQGYDSHYSVSSSSDWLSCVTGSAPSTMHLSLPETPPDENHSLVLGIGIRFGVMHDVDTIRQVRYGVAKIIEAA